jgi:hypothetical protein
MAAGLAATCGRLGRATVITEKQNNKRTKIKQRDIFYAIWAMLADVRLRAHTLRVG